MSNAIKQMADHLAKQRDQSIQIDGDGSKYCAYRTTGGEMCAVGCLIPDELYTREMERNPAQDLMCDFTHIESLFKELLGDKAEVIVAAAQDYHDNGDYEVDIYKHKDKSDEEFSAHIVEQIERIQQQFMEEGYQ